MRRTAASFSFSLALAACAFLLACHALPCLASEDAGRQPRRKARPAVSPESCLDEIDRQAGRAFDDAEREGRGVDSVRLRAQAEAIALRCIPAFSVSTARLRQLPALARLYVEAGRHSSADAAIGRYLKSPLVSTRRKGDALLRVINSSLYSYSLYAPADPERAAQAETYLKKLKALGPAFARQQLDAHAQLAKHYLLAGLKADALRHQAEVVRLGGRLKADERLGALTEVILGLSVLADFKCNEEGSARALALLDGISPELVRLAGAERILSAARSRYELGVGPAPELRPLYILNDAAGAASAGAPARVTVLLFAAHWCGPCRALYPRVTEVYERFRADGLRVLLVTRLYGYFAARAGLKPEEELSALRDYYVGEMRLPFPVLVESQAPQKGNGTNERQPGAVAERDSVLFGNLPLMLVVDHSGRTRAVLLGAMFDQRERLQATVEELLKEPR